MARDDGGQLSAHTANDALIAFLSGDAPRVIALTSKLAERDAAIEALVGVREQRDAARFLAAGWRRLAERRHDIFAAERRAHAFGLLDPEDR